MLVEKTVIVELGESRPRPNFFIRIEKPQEVKIILLKKIILQKK